MPPITEDAKNAPINWTTMVSGGDGSVATATATATVKCPRCDSPNTKFCYYNNYSLSQPRHFCKTCRRYWTKGGALRNIPVGGGCRKNKKSRSSFSTLSSAAKLFSPSSSSSSSSSSHHHQHQLLLPPPDRNTFFKSQVLGFGTIASPSQGFATPFLSFGDLSSRTEAEAQQPVVESGKNHNLLLTSSMESLFSTNHLLHWKLQQQQQQKQKQMLASPLEFLLQNNNSTSASPSEAQLPVFPSSFHLLQQPSFPFHVAPTEGSAVEQVGGSRINGDSTSDWFLGNSYMVEGFNPNVNSSSRADWTAAIPTWNLDMDRFTAL